MKRAVSMMLGVVLALGAVGVEAKTASRSTSSRSVTKSYSAPKPVTKAPVTKPAPSKTHAVAGAPKKKSWSASLFDDVVQSDREQDLAEGLEGCEIELLPNRKYKIDCDD